MTSSEFAANRRTLGLSQAALALLIGCQQPDIARLETTRQPTRWHSAVMRTLLLLHKYGLLKTAIAELPPKIKKLDEMLRDELN